MEQKLDIKTATEFCKNLFAQKIQWDRADLIIQVAKMYEEKYGDMPLQDTTRIVKKTLDSLQTDGYVQNIGKGLWALSEKELKVIGSNGNENLKIQIPLQPVYARKLIRQLFSKQSRWDRSDLVDELVKIHLNDGNVIGTQDPTTVVKKTLTYLQDADEVKNEGKGIWTRQDTIQRASVEEKNIANESDETDAEVAEAVSDRTVLGVGSEFVYLYYYENDKKIAEIQGRQTWDCKIGFTTDQVDRRVFGQSKTARARKPIIALVIQTDYAAYLEDAIHASLKLAECYVSEGYETGTEWFDTNPQKIIKWYEDFVKITNSLKFNN